MDRHQTGGKFSDQQPNITSGWFDDFAEATTERTAVSELHNDVRAVVSGLTYIVNVH